MKRAISIFLVTVLAIMLFGCSPSSTNIGGNSSNPITTQPSTFAPTSSTDGTPEMTPTSADNTISAPQGKLTIHYIDVGQADSILLMQNGHSMLIDAGNNADSNAVVNYIREQGINKLDYIVGTHPHEDHIGGMDAVIDTFSIGTIYMPKVTSNTKTFEDVITAIKNKGLSITTPKPGSTFKLGDAVCTILAPNNGSYVDLNNYSIVLKVVFGSNRFLFQGDAQEQSENEILSKGFNIGADVIKIGHHGSSTSSIQAYLNEANTKYAVISVSKGNDYGHPAASTMDKLQSMGIKVYRTDESGTIICTSDGKNISFNCQPGSYGSGSGGGGSGTSSDSSGGSNTVIIPPPPSGSDSGVTDNKSITVYVTETGSKYHRDGCRYLSKSKIPISLKDARSEGYGPCSVCSPPR